MKVNRKYLILALIIIISLVIFDQFYQLKYQEGAANPPPTPTPSATEINSNLVIVENILNGTTKFNGAEIAKIPIMNIKCVLPAGKDSNIIVYTSGENIPSNPNMVALSFNETIQCILALCKNALFASGQGDIVKAYTDALNNGRKYCFLTIYCCHLQTLKNAMDIILRSTNKNDINTLAQIIFNNIYPFIIDETQNNNNKYGMNFINAIHYVDRLLNQIFSLGLYNKQSDSDFLCMYSMQQPDSVSGFIPTLGSAIETILNNILIKSTNNTSRSAIGIKEFVAVDVTPQLIVDLDHYGVSANGKNGPPAYKSPFFTYKDDKLTTTLFDKDMKRTSVSFPAQISGQNIMPSSQQVGALVQSAPVSVPSNLPTILKPTTLKPTTLKPT